MTPVISLEEHFSIPELSSRIDPDLVRRRGWPSGDEQGPSMKQAARLLAEIGEERIQLMDEAGITMQVLSSAGPGAELLPGEEGVNFAFDYNNALAEKIKEFPGRFSGFAHLPVLDPDAAATELDRAVTELNFCGAMINGTIDGLFLDDPFFSPNTGESRKAQCSFISASFFSCSFCTGSLL